jgi:hypothetical protein
MIASAAVFLVFGIIHLLYTFRGPKLTPRDPELRQRMEAVSPVITTETTMWKAWLGFNATHSLALILFGVMYGYLALAKFELLMHSPVLLAIGFAMLVALVVRAKLYFFSGRSVGSAWRWFAMWREWWWREWAQVSAIAARTWGTRQPPAQPARPSVRWRLRWLPPSPLQLF